MVDNELVLCEPMCFLVNKYGKLSPKVLKNALIEFYSVDILTSAKIRLLEDVHRMDFPEKLPHIPKRRDTANRLNHEVDDMLALMQFIDERGHLSSLPRYVSSGPDNMPSIRMFDGDLQFLLSRLDKLEDNLVGLGSALAAINAQLQSRPTQHASLGAKVLSTTQYQAHSKPKPTNSTAYVNLPSAQTGIPTFAPLINTDDNEFPALKTSWAERTASTPNLQRSSRDKALSSQSESNDEQFTEVRPRKKRLRLRSNEPITENTGQSRPRSSKSNNRPLMIGKMSSDGNSTSRLITAAQQKNQFLKKAVFYIGNVDKAVTVDQMHAFVTGLSVEVLSLFEAKPRQYSRLADTMVDCTTAFRLCINKDHCDRLLDETKWPAFISVSEWSFKPPARPIPPNLISQTGTISKGVVAVVNANTAQTEFADDNDQLNCSDDADNTIIMCDHSQDQIVSTQRTKNGE